MTPPFDDTHTPVIELQIAPGLVMVCYAAEPWLRRFERQLRRRWCSVFGHRWSRRHGLTNPGDPPEFCSRCLAAFYLPPWPAPPPGDCPADRSAPPVPVSESAAFKIAREAFRAHVIDEAPTLGDIIVETSRIVEELWAFYPRDEARAWLNAPHALLEGDTPLQRIAQGKAADVRAVIAQLRDGAYT